MQQTQTHPSERILDLLAKLRTRQLDLAIKGDVEHSAAYAKRARRVRRAAQGQRVKAC